jgi:hypothetical protein
VIKRHYYHWIEQPTFEYTKCVPLGVGKVIFQMEVQCLKGENEVSETNNGTYNANRVVFENISKLLVHSSRDEQRCNSTYSNTPSVFNFIHLCLKKKAYHCTYAVKQ